MTARRLSVPLVVLNAIKLCKNPNFQQFLNASSEAGAKDRLCELCQIQSRNELATDQAALNEFSGIIARFNRWLNLPTTQ